MKYIQKIKIVLIIDTFLCWIDYKGHGMIERLGLNRNKIYIVTAVVILLRMIIQYIIVSDYIIELGQIVKLLIFISAVRLFIVVLVKLEFKNEYEQLGTASAELDDFKNDSISNAISTKFKEMRFLDYIVFALILIALALTIRNLYGFARISFWRQDAIYYLGHYSGKLGTEGRWINFIVFYLLKFIPAILSISIHYFAIGFFSYKATMGITKNSGLSALVAFAVINMTPITNQLMWPVTTLPGYLFLGAIPFFYKKFSTWSLFAICGIAFFGTLSNYYFIIPILLLGDLLEYTKDKDFKESIVFTVKQIVIPWVVGFLVGYIIANLITALMVGHFIELAEWRNSQPVDSFSQLITNVENIISYIIVEFKYLYNSLGYILIGVAVVMSLISFRVKKISYAIICMLVALSVFGSTVLDGILISHRTVVPFVMAMLFLVTLPKFRFSYKYIINIFLVFGIVISFSISSYERINWYRIVSNNYYDEIIEGIENYDPKDFDAVIILMGNDEVADFTRAIEIENDINKPEGIEGLYSRMRVIIPPLKELGYKNFYENPSDYEFEKTYDSDSKIIKKIDGNNLVIYFNI